MKIPVPFEVDGEVFSDVEIKPYTAGVLADTRNAMESGDYFRGLQTFIAGCLESMGPVVERARIKTLSKLLPQKSAEFIVAKIALLNCDDDGLEGIYQCPMNGCGHSLRCEKTEDTDTRDFFSDLPVEYSDEVPAYVLELEKEITIPALADEISSVKSMNFTFPTLLDGINAYATAGGNDQVRLQLAIYRECLIGINGQPVDKKWKQRYALRVLEQIERNDMKDIAKSMNAYGVTQTVSRRCPKCGKVFETAVNTSDFFVSALRSA